MYYVFVYISNICLVLQLWFHSKVMFVHICIAIYAYIYIYLHTCIYNKQTLSLDLSLGGGFKYLLFSPLPAQMIQSD